MHRAVISLILLAIPAAAGAGPAWICAVTGAGAARLAAGRATVAPTRMSAAVTTHSARIGRAGLIIGVSAWEAPTGDRERAPGPGVRCHVVNMNDAEDSESG